jgi:hypothetical protein
MEITGQVSLTIEIDSENLNNCGPCQFQFWNYCYLFKQPLKHENEQNFRCSLCLEIFTKEAPQ